MSAISTQIVIDGITLALRDAFPDSFITAKPVEQGLRRPAFIVHPLIQGESDLPSNRSRRFSSFVIHHFPEHPCDDWTVIGDALLGVLKVITLPGGDMLRGTDISYECVDGVLHFSVTYKYSISGVSEAPVMENLSIIQGGQ